MNRKISFTVDIWSQGKKPGISQSGSIHSRKWAGKVRRFVTFLDHSWRQRRIWGEEEAAVADFLLHQVVYYSIFPLILLERKRPK